MYQNDYEKTQQNHGEEESQRTEYRDRTNEDSQTEEGMEAMQKREAEDGRSSSSGAPISQGSEGQPSDNGKNPYGSSSPVSANSYGNYGNGQPGAYGRPSGSYGNQQSAQGSGYGGSQMNHPGAGYGPNPQVPSGNYGTRPSGPNPGYGGQPPYQQHYAPWQQPQPGSRQPGQKLKKEKKPHPMLKKAAGITVAALLFGVIAGGTMAGVNQISGRLLAGNETESSQAALTQAETMPETSKPDTANTNPAPAVPAVSTDVSAIVEKAMPSVVAINSVTEYQTQNWFGQTQIYEGKGSGSGIIVGQSDEELLIVTNNHVVEGAKTLGVVFVDNEIIEANVKGTDSENDLAVIAVDLTKIPDDTKSKIAVATLGDSNSLKVGQGVIAIGNALGYGQSVTVGYVSALDREVKTEQQTARNLLQTDAAINPGNSGGALLNMKGEVIGINSAKYSSTEVEGMGYAIPISKVQDIIGNLMTKKTRKEVEEARQGYLGIQGQDIDANTSLLYGMPQGVFVYRIMEEGAAAGSDLKEKDIITKFDGQSIRTMSELKAMLTYYAGGDTIKLTVQSLSDGEYVERQVEVTLGVKPAENNVN